jgi:putative transcriptional regulator
MRLTAKQIKERDAKRDIGAELLQAVRDLKAGKGKITARVANPSNSL